MSHRFFTQDVTKIQDLPRMIDWPTFGPPISAIQVPLSHPHRLQPNSCSSVANFPMTINLIDLVHLTNYSAA